MLKTYLYVPEELNLKIVKQASKRKVSKASVIREALEKGLEVIGDRYLSPVETFAQLAQIGKKYKIKGPKDLSTNLDKYLWDDYEP